MLEMLVFCPHFRSHFRFRALVLKFSSHVLVPSSSFFCSIFLVQLMSAVSHLIAPMVTSIIQKIVVTVSFGLSRGAQLCLCLCE